MGGQSAGARGMVKLVATVGTAGLARTWRRTAQPEHRKRLNARPRPAPHTFPTPEDCTDGAKTPLQRRKIFLPGPPSQNLPAFQPMQNQLLPPSCQHNTHRNDSGKAIFRFKTLHCNAKSGDIFISWA